MLVDAAAADGALNRLEVDKLGLDAMDRRYLTMIADIYRGGPVGVETLAAGLSEPRDTVEEVIEPYLIQLGLIARTARGRCLNAGGWKHLGLNPPAGSQDGLFDSLSMNPLGAEPTDFVMPGLLTRVPIVFGRFNFASILKRGPSRKACAHLYLRSPSCSRCCMLQRC